MLNLTVIYCSGLDKKPPCRKESGPELSMCQNPQMALFSGMRAWEMQDRPSAFTGCRTCTCSIPPYLLPVSGSCILTPMEKWDGKPKWWHRGEKISDGKKIAIEAVVLGGGVWSYFRTWIQLICIGFSEKNLGSGEENSLGYFLKGDIWVFSWKQCFSFKSFHNIQ